MVYGSEGQPVEVILSIDDYRAYLRDLARNYDWELLPEHLQDAVDKMLMDESRENDEELIPFEQVMSGE